jgi:hypothetical protein
LAVTLSARVCSRDIQHTVLDKRCRSLTSTSIESILYERMADMDRLVAEGGGLAEILVRIRDDPPTLTAGEHARYLAYERLIGPIINSITMKSSSRTSRGG